MVPSFFLDIPRLRLRKLCPEDLDTMYHATLDYEVMKYIKPVYTDIAQAQADLNQYLTYYEKHPGLGVFYMETHEGEFVGFGTLKHPNPEREEVEVGYRLMKKFWGQGYATELAIALLKYGFEEVGLERIIAVARPENKASLRVMQKAGMTHIGMSDKFHNALLVCYEKNKNA
jgi:ribosomal-protein-alanine N-acetyltransferase